MRKKKLKLRAKYRKWYPTIRNAQIKKSKTQSMSGMIEYNITNVRLYPRKNIVETGNITE